MAVRRSGSSLIQHEHEFSTATAASPSRGAHPRKVLTDKSRALAGLHGRAMVELATAVRGGAALSRLAPLI